MNKINEYVMKIQILYLAKTRLELGQSEYVCHAIRDALYSHESALAKSYLLSYVENQLGNHYTLDSWLSANRPKIPSNQMKEYRIQWIDWMINQYEDQMVEESKY